MYQGSQGRETLPFPTASPTAADQRSTPLGNRRACRFSAFATACATRFPGAVAISSPPGLLARYILPFATARTSLQRSTKPEEYRG